MTGLGYCDGFDLVAPSSSLAAYTDHGARTDSHALYFYSREYLAFPLHEFCWRLLLCRLNIEVATSSSCAQAIVARMLFDLLYCMHWGLPGCLLPERRYYGAADARNSISDQPKLLADPEQLAPNPNDLALPDPPEQPPRTTTRENCDLARDCFYRLPLEIVCAILTFLPSRDVCSARLASRKVAAVSDESGLPEVFWASRFDLDREMGFAFAKLQGAASNNKRCPRYWHTSYQLCKRALQPGSGFDGLRNRRRIWLCVANFAATIVHLLRGRHAKPEESDGATSPAYRRRLSQQVGCPQLSRESHRHSSDLHFGARHFKTESLIWVRASSSSDIAICGWSTPFDNGAYIAGLCAARYADEQPISASTNEAGYILPHIPDKFILGPQDYVFAIDVTISASGIHGLCFHVQRVGRTSAEAVGDVSCRDHTVGVSRLESAGRIIGLRLEFEVSTNHGLSLIAAAEPHALGLQSNIRGDPRVR